MSYKFCLRKENRFAATWVIVTHTDRYGDNVFIGAKSIMGDIKASLHATGVCQISFDRASDIKTDFIEKTGNRHMISGSYEVLSDSLKRGLAIYTNTVDFQEGIEEQYPERDVELIDVQENGWVETNFFLSQDELKGWPGKNSFKTKPIHKTRIKTSWLYVVYRTLDSVDIRFPDSTPISKEEYEQIKESKRVRAFVTANQKIPDGKILCAIVDRALTVD